MLKRILKVTTVITILLIVILNTTMVSYASESYLPTINTSTTWKTLATSTTGFNKNVTVFNWSTGTDGLGILRADIRLLGKNGNVVWSESKSCPGYGTRVYWCGTDVYTIQIKVLSGGGTARAYK